MIKAQHKKFWEWFFVIYSRIYLWFIFQEIRYIPLYKENVNKDRSVVIISNHFFFWDGFIHLLLNRKFFKRKIHIMMLHEELVKRRFLRYGGTFSIDKGGRSIIESLDYCRDILKNPGNSLLIFPQGKIESLYTYPYKFEKGVEYILKRAPNADIYLNLNHINFYSQRRPTLSIYLKPLSSSGHEINIEKIEAEFNRFASEVNGMENTDSDNFA